MLHVRVSSHHSFHLLPIQQFKSKKIQVFLEAKFPWLLSSGYFYCAFVCFLLLHYFSLMCAVFTTHQQCIMIEMLLPFASVRKPGENTGSCTVNKCLEEVISECATKEIKGMKKQEARQSEYPYIQLLYVWPLVSKDIPKIFLDPLKIANLQILKSTVHLRKSSRGLL